MVSKKELQEDIETLKLEIENINYSLDVLRLICRKFDYRFYHAEWDVHPTREMLQSEGYRYAGRIGRREVYIRPDKPCTCKKEDPNDPAS